MRVLDYEPQLWYLLADGDELLFNVNCNHGGTGYDFSIALDESERSRLNVQGRDFLNELAEGIHFSAPGVRGNNSPYRERRLNTGRDAAVSRAIASWLVDNDKFNPGTVA